MTREQFGWTSFFESQESSGFVGRVAAANHGRFLVWTETGEVDAGVSGLLRKGSPLWPAVGDFVVLHADSSVIVKVLDRKTKLSRKQPEREIREQVLAANIDVLFIVSGLDRDYNERRIERYLVMARAKRRAAGRPTQQGRPGRRTHGLDLAGRIVARTEGMDRGSAGASRERARRASGLECLAGPLC